MIALRLAICLHRLGLGEVSDILGYPQSSERGSVLYLQKVKILNYV